MMSGNSPGQYARVPPHDPTALRFRVPDEERLLAEVLAERGYDTFYEAENPVATRANALQGLAPWPRPGDGAPALDPRLGFTAEIRRYHSLLPALRYLLQPVRRPFYGLFWFNDPHAPYQPPATRRGHLDVPDLPRPVEFYLGLGHAHRPARGQHKLRDVAQDLSVQEIGFLKRLYLAEVESIDERVGYLLRALELSGRRDRTFVVFTSDHGEAFGEHGNFLHGQGFYDEVSRVPLLLAGPGVPPGMVVEDPVSLLDLMPTLADLLAAPCLESPQGRSLVPYLTGEAGDELRDRPHYLVNPSRAEGTDAVVWGRYKLITTDHDRELELYDLLDDPGETRNRAAERPAVVARLLRAARAQRAVDRERRNALAVAEGRAPEEVRAEDEETRRQLKALGYLD
jgi:arylsulfatase A-like enzyme